MDRDAAGNDVHGMHGDCVLAGAARNCARVHAGCCVDSGGEQIAFCGGVFSAVRWDADGGDGSFARGGGYADADALPFVFLLAGGIAAGGAALFSLGMGRAGNVGGVERGADFDWERAALFLATEGTIVCDDSVAAGQHAGCDGVMAGGDALRRGRERRKAARYIKATATAKAKEPAGRRRY